MSSSKRPAKKPRRGAPPPASARLTIKRTGANARAIVDLPPRPRPSGERRLSEVVLEEDETLTEGFDALLNGVKVRVTAVLERTCVYLSKEGERRLASKKDLVVEADKLPIRRRGFG